MNNISQTCSLQYILLLTHRLYFHAHCAALTPQPNSFISHMDGQFSLGLLLP